MLVRKRGDKNLQRDDKTLSKHTNTTQNGIKYLFIAIENFNQNCIRFILNANKCPAVAIC